MPLSRFLQRAAAALPAAALLLLVPAPAGASRGCAHAGARPTAGSLPQVRAATLCLLNRERTSRGLPALRPHPALRAAATGHSRAMVRHRFFSHDSAVTGSTVESRIRATGFLRGAGSWLVGENIAWGSGRLATPRRTVGAWMRSPGHRANILQGGYRHIGIGVALGAPQPVPGRAATYTTDFGTRR